MYIFIFLKLITDYKSWSLQKIFKLAYSLLMYLTCTYIKLDYIFRFWDIFQDVGLPVWYPDQGIKSVCWTLWADNSAICLGPLQPLCYVRSDGSLPYLSLSLSVVYNVTWITILYQSVTYTKYSIYSGIFAKKEVLFFLVDFFFLLFFFSLYSF